MCDHPIIRSLSSILVAYLSRSSCLYLCIPGWSRRGVGLGSAPIGHAPQTGTPSWVGCLGMGTPWSAFRADPALRGCPKRQSWRRPLGETTFPPAAHTRPMSPLNLSSHSSEMVYLAERAPFPPPPPKKKSRFATQKNNGERHGNLLR